MQGGRHVAAADECDDHHRSASWRVRSRATAERCMRRRSASAAPDPRAEDRRADAHHRRALGDRRLEVGRHAHRQRVDREPAARQRVGAIAPARGTARAAARRRGRLGDAHQAAQPQPRQRRRPPRQRQRARPARTPLLVASPLTLTCTQTVERRQVRRARARQPRGDLHAVDVCTQSNAPAASAVLLLCSGPMRCHSTSREVGQRVRSWPPPPARSSRRTHAARAACTARTAAAGNVLLTASSATVAGSRPAGPRRGGDALARGLPRLLVVAHNRIDVGMRAAIAGTRSCMRRRVAAQDRGCRHRGLPRDYRWTSPNCWPSPSRTRPPTCTCRRACRR